MYCHYIVLAGVFTAYAYPTSFVGNFFSPGAVGVLGGASCTSGTTAYMSGGITANGTAASIAFDIARGLSNFKSGVEFLTSQ
jgi:hypothetical protein